MAITVAIGKHLEYITQETILQWKHRCVYTENCIVDYLFNGLLTPLLMHCSYVFLALTHRYCHYRCNAFRLLFRLQCDTLPQGWGLLSQFPPFRYFPKFSALSKHTLTVRYRVYIWQVSPKLSCGDTCQIWMWFEESNMYFCEIKNFAYGEINERSFSNPHPWPIVIATHIPRPSPPLVYDCLPSQMVFWLLPSFVQRIGSMAEAT